MIEIIKELKIEVSKPNVFQAIVAKQYDMNTRFLKVTLMDCGTRIDVPNNGTTTVVINAKRSDGQADGFAGVINDDGTVTVPLHSWMLELVGEVVCDISVIDAEADDNKKLTTTSFTLLVEKATYGGDDVTNDPQYDVLVSLMEEVENLSLANVSLTYDPQSNEAMSGKAVAEAVKQTSTGKKTEAGGEVFNDGENNVAGSKAFKIVDFDSSAKTLTLDSTEGLEVGDEYSCQLNANFDFWGNITQITDNIITIDVVPTPHINGNAWDVGVSDNSVLWIPSKPHIGTVLIGKHSSARGSENISSQYASSSEGYNNITSGKYGHTEGRDNKAGYAAHGEGQETEAKGLWSHSQNLKTKALGDGSSAGGYGTIAKEPFQDVRGTFNKDNPDAIAIVGNGTSESVRSNAFEVMKDGSARINKQGTTDDSVVRLDYFRENTIEKYFLLPQRVEALEADDYGLKVSEISDTPKCKISIHSGEPSQPAKITVYNKNILYPKAGYSRINYTASDAGDFSVRMEDSGGVVVSGTVPNYPTFGQGWGFAAHYIVSVNDPVHLVKGTYTLSGLPYSVYFDDSDYPVRFTMRNAKTNANLAVIQTWKTTTFEISENVDVYIMLSFKCGTEMKFGDESGNYDYIRMFPMLEYEGSYGSAFVKAEAPIEYEYSEAEDMGTNAWKYNFEFNAPFNALTVFINPGFNLWQGGLSIDYYLKKEYPIITSSNDGTAELIKMGQNDRSIPTKSYVDSLARRVDKLEQAIISMGGNV